MSTLQKRYKTEVVKKLQDSGKFKNPMEIPRLLKVVVNMSVSASADKDALKMVADELMKITGQKPIITKARKSIANFKLREGMPIGAKVTLRGPMMFDFMERLISATLPRIRDFRGVSRTGFDGRGNYSLGIKEQLIFPEISYDKVDKIKGMNIVFTTTAKTDEEAYALLELLGMPFEK